MRTAETLDVHLGDAIARSDLQDLAVARERRRVVASDQGVEGKTGQADEPRRLGRGLQLGAGTVDTQQLVDRDARTPTLDGDLVDRPYAQTVAGLAERVVADARQRAVGLV